MLDDAWDQLGQPDPFLLVDAGAGRGALTLAVLRAGPRCAPTLRCALVERSPRLRARHGEHLPLEPAAWALGPVLSGEAEEPAHPAPGTGPLVVSLADLPAVRADGVVIANELLDNLPFRLLERGATTWGEVRVAATDDDHLVEVVVDAPPALVELGERLAPDAPAGGRVPVQRRAATWLVDALAIVEGGRVVVVDYADTSASMATRPWTDWVRTYRGHGRGGQPLEGPGTQDVTCEVAVDQLARARTPAADRSQAEFLRAHGIDDLVAEGRRIWEERAGVGDLAAIEARSRVSEAEALLDDAGLGAFRVLEWEAGETLPARK